jgi:hypothetical protein
MKVRGAIALWGVTHKALMIKGNLDVFGKPLNVRVVLPTGNFRGEFPRDTHREMIWRNIQC